MRTKKLNRKASETMHENCMHCMSKSCCTICKDYKELKDNGFTATGDLICFMAILDREVTRGFKELKNYVKDFETWALKMHLQSYAKTFELLWNLYRNNEEKLLSKDLRKYVCIYTCYTLEKHGLLGGIEAMTGIDLTTQYNEFFAELVIEGINKNAKIF